MTLFDYPRDAKEVGISRAWAGTDDEWKLAAMDAARELCRTRAEFTTDDLPAEIRNGVREPRALGALMTNARRAGLCEVTERMRVSTSDVCHRRRKAVWKSLKFGS